MLKLRIISALVMVPLVIWGVLTLNNTEFAIALLLLIALAAWEWAGLVPLQHGLQRLLYIASVVLVLSVTWQFASQDLFVYGLLWLTLGWWLFALYWISYPGLIDAARTSTSWLKIILGWLLLASTWLALVVLHSRPDHGPYWVLFVMSLVWVADSGAYFSGRQWGRRKLAPQVSPGKTWAGVYGAVAACTVYTLIVSHFMDITEQAIPGFVLASLVTVLFSIAGDLIISLFKRHQNLKDSGHLIPGHGGLLDRVDSLLAAAPVFVLGLHWIDL